MDTLPYLLPWILLLLAAATAAAVKFLPFKSIAGIAVISVLSLFMLLIAIYANIITSQQFQAVDEKAAELAALEEWKYSHLDELTLILAQMKPPSDQEQALLKELISYGWLRQNPSVLKAQQAHQARQRLVADYEPEKPMLIKGIPTTVDDKIVQLSLREIGFIVLPYREDETPETDVNIIYFGRDMDLEAVKLAALTLMQAGVDLKAIKPFPKATQGNLRAIKIEWNKYYEGRKSMDIDGIESAKGFN
jgi:hypothetical protein